MLHVVNGITRHGHPMKYDGSRGEFFDKLKNKYNFNLTNTEKETLNFDINCRISEEDIVRQISIVYYQNKGYRVLKYCNEIDIMLNTNRTQINAEYFVEH